MRRALRRALCAALSALLLGFAGAALADAQQDAATNMELPVGSFSELCRQVPDVPLMDAPHGATDVAYSVVGDTPTIAQIKFVLHDRNFCYRAARFSNSSTMPDISGMRNEFDAQMELGGVLYRQDASTGAGVASWYYESTHSQYSVAMQRAFDAEYMRQVVVAMRSQGGTPPKSVPAVKGTQVIGTVTDVTASRITVRGIRSESYTFAIDHATALPRGGVVRNDIVRVTFGEPYAADRPAYRIERIEAAGKSPQSTTASRATKSGTILSRGAERLQIRRPSGSIYTFYTGAAAIHGDMWAGVGDSATVTYYVSSSGSKIATKITYTAAYTPIPQPWPPDPGPVPYPWTMDPNFTPPPDPGPLLGG